MTHPPGMVVIPCQETARYHRFTLSLSDLQMPEGSRKVFGFGTSIVDNLNTALRALKDEEQWVWLIGDDHIFEPDVLMRLLDRQADIIAPLCTQRFAPFGLVHFDGMLTDEFHSRVQFDELPEDDEPFEVTATGSAMLIRRPVLEAVGDPWFRNSRELLTEDLDFCDKARRAGFKILVDPTTALGHIGQMIVYPQRREGVWGLVVDYLGQGQSFYPGGVAEEANLGTLEPVA